MSQNSYGKSPVTNRNNGRWSAANWNHAVWQGAWSQFIVGGFPRWFYVSDFAQYSWHCYDFIYGPGFAVSLQKSLKKKTRRGFQRTAREDDCLAVRFHSKPRLLPSITSTPTSQLLSPAHLSLKQARGSNAVWAKDKAPRATRASEFTTVKTRKWTKLSSPCGPLPFLSFLSLNRFASKWAAWVVIVLHSYSRLWT